MARKGLQNGKCKACAHPERVRLDYLCASGASIAPLAAKHGLTNDSLSRHYRNHVSAEFKAQVRVGPFGSEENLRRICNESGVSVLETLQAVRGGLMSRWLANLEAGADQALVNLTGKVHENIGLQARVTGEIMPAPSSVVVNNILMQDPATLKFVSRLMSLVRKHPQVREDLVAIIKESFAEGAAVALPAPEAAHAA